MKIVRSGEVADEGRKQVIEKRRYENCKRSPQEIKIK